MEQIFECSYAITKKVFVDWALNPVNRGFKRLRDIISAVGTAGGFALLVAAAALKDWLYAALGGAALIYFLYCLLLRTRLVAAQRYKMMRALQTGGEWVRTIRFGDRVEVIDNNTTTVYDYSQFTATEETGWYFILRFGRSQCLRVARNGFTTGSYEDFKSFVADKLAKS